MRAWRRAAAAAALLPAFGAAAVELTLWHTYGEFVDRGQVNAGIYVSEVSSRVDCSVPPAVTRTGNAVLVTARKARSTSDPSACVGAATANLGEFSAGAYEVTVRLASADGATFEEVSQPMAVETIAGRCNATPQLSPSLIVSHRTLNAAQLAQRAESDAEFAARIGNPVVFDYGIEIGPRSYALLAWPPLHDPVVEIDRLTLTGEFQSVERNGHVCPIHRTPDDVSTFVEYYSRSLDHYFYSGAPSEIATLDAGRIGDWQRTGASFRAITSPGCPLATPATVVYRFYGIPGKGPNSHFFTRDRAECHTVDASAKWMLEGVPFWATAPDAQGRCTADDQMPLYRVWRPFGDSNHRFTTDRALAIETKLRGWVDEGVAMCVARD